MLKELGSRWRTVLALLIAVATALMFSTATPPTQPALAQGEAFCVPEAHDTPAISKQESSDQSAPRGETHALTGPPIGGLAFMELQALGVGAFPVLHFPVRSRPPGGLYPRGPPTLA
jgi:hypothetical protein